MTVEPDNRTGSRKFLGLQSAQMASHCFPRFPGSAPLPAILRASVVPGAESEQAGSCPMPSRSEQSDRFLVVQRFLFPIVAIFSKSPGLLPFNRTWRFGELPAKWQQHKVDRLCVWFFFVSYQALILTCSRQGVYKSGNSTDFLRAVQKYWRSAEVPQEGPEFFSFFVIFVAVRTRNSNFWNFRNFVKWRYWKSTEFCCWEGTEFLGKVL